MKVRRPSYVLTTTGQKKIYRKFPQGYNCSQIAREALMHRTTVARIMQKNQGVNFSNLEKIFNCLNLDLEETDYEEIQNLEEGREKKWMGTQTPTNSQHLVDGGVLNPKEKDKLTKYVERPLIEQRVYRSLLFTDCILRIKAPKNMGKTMLIDQVLEQLKAKENYRIVSISFRDADNSHLSELNKLLCWLYTNVSDGLKDKLKFLHQLSEWDNSTKIFGSKKTCTNYFEQYVLRKINQPLVLCLDNLELLFLNENICQEFLGMLRSWNDKSSRNSPWQKLRLVLSYAPNTDIKINPNQSPFNIGTVIELPEFTVEQVQQFAEIYQLNWDDFQVRELMNMVGGHPYLLELTFRSLQTFNDMTLEEVLETAPTKDGIYHSPHLQEYLAILKQHLDLAKVFLSIIKGEYLGEMESHGIKTLMNLGLVKYQDGKVLVRCELYRLYFENYLGDVS
ncbi:MAG: hypothetical protein F6K54_17410 [Okeania sp. SIO3B5]|uniref:AAA-like domain-containing protein n=1 Tax=Okeania sp. SIO3B5 TaxID=2607811 RepID=UPI0014012DB3|nr:AAA-like domain-containing protein [Okeania sp. SIO3B5]NEO54699.1 hypothetical protein [Okeania sp. SIO3B5]